MICAARQDADPAAVTCSAALGGGKAKCACGQLVKGEPVVSGLSWERETREARVPDSARDDEG